MELYSYTLNVRRPKTEDEEDYTEDYFSPILPLPMLLELLAEALKQVKPDEIVQNVNIRPECYCKIKVKDSFKEVLGNLVPSEHIFVSKTSIDEITGNTLYHHFVFHEGEWSEGRISSIAVEEVIMPVAKWYSVKRLGLSFEQE